jgi:predicted permease
MRWLDQIPLRLRSLFRKERVEQEMDDELRFHLERQIEENLKAGMSLEEARYAALRKFGGVEQVKEECRDAWGVRFIESLLQDVRFALRQLRRNPGFTAVAVLTLALGIGANTAIFTLVHAVMLKSLPVGNPNQLYRVGNDDNCCVVGGFQDNWGIYSYPLYQQFRNHTPEFSELAAFQGGLESLSARRIGSSGATELYIGEFVSGNYFKMFGISAFVGRVITPADDKPGAVPVAVMSYRTWQQHLGLDPSVVGATFNINQTPYTIAGIAPPGFFGDRLRPDPPDFWLPLCTEPVLKGAGSILNHADDHWLYVIGRLKPGAHPASVQTEVTTELQQWVRAHPDVRLRDRPNIPRQHINLVPAGAGVRILQDEVKDGLRLLVILSGFVLLIACANIANLLLARAAARHAETAIRVALGAPRWRIIRQVITESVLLAVLGGATGLYAAYGAARAILYLAFRGAQYVPINPDPSIPVLGFAFLLSLGTGIVFGAAPAWFTSRSEPAEALRGAGRGTVDSGSLARRSLVVLQVALSAILLIGAGLLTRSLRNLENQKFGFEPQGRFIVRVDPSLAGYKPGDLYGLYQQLEQRLPQIPGVLSASYSLYSPMRGDNWSMDFYAEGQPLDKELVSSWDRVSPRYFATIGTHLIRGRVIGDEDTPTSHYVAVINQAFARKFFPNQDPLSKHIGRGDPSHAGDYEVIGIVEDAKYQDARGPAYATAFFPLLQTVPYKDTSNQTVEIRSTFIGDIELRVAGKPESLEADVRRALADINPDLTILHMVSLDEQLSRNFNQERLIARLTGLFGLVALILACVGLYGVTAFSVARRTNEIGIRIALGADRKNVLGLVMRGALAQVAIGLAIGIPLALAGGRLVASQLYGVRSYDPVIVALAAVILTACILVAGFVPARRATKVDPMVALRYE